MGNGATYWGNSEGRNEETSNKAGRPNSYPGTQDCSDMKKKPTGQPGQKDSTEVPEVNE